MRDDSSPLTNNDTVLSLTVAARCTQLFACCCERTAEETAFNESRLYASTSASQISLPTLPLFNNSRHLKAGIRPSFKYNIHAPSLEPRTGVASGPPLEATMAGLLP